MGHRHRIRRYGDAFSFPAGPKRLIEDFNRLVIIETNECVRWPGHLKAGYGYITVDNKFIGVHVLACTRRHGERPTDRHEAAHSCRNRDCMNYRHLRWATRRENILDRVRDGTDNRGEKHPMAKLTTEQVVNIRTRSDTGETHSNLALAYGVSAQTISNVVHRETWAWLA